MRFAALALLFPFLAAAQAQDVPGDEGPFIYSTQRWLPFSADGTAFARTVAATAAATRMLDNPALLAGLGGGVHVAGVISPAVYGFEDIDTQSGALAVGAELRAGGRPLAVVGGVAHGAIRYGVIPVTTPTGPDPASATYDVSERTTSAGAGVEWRGPVAVRVGLALRSHVQPSFNVGTATEARALVADLGLGATLPLGRRWADPAAALRPVLDVTVGGALRGLTLSNDSERDDYARTEPVAQTVLGLAVEGGVEQGGALPIRTAGAAVFAESQGDDLGATDATRFGVRFEMIEALSAGVSRLDGRTRAVGVGVSAGGLLRAVGSFTDDAGLYAPGRRFDLRYTYAFSGVDGFDASTGTHGVVLRVRP